MRPAGECACFMGPSMHEIDNSSRQKSDRLKGQHYVLLQGPLGPFFADLARHLMDEGATVERVCFNKGDWHYAFGTSVIRFQSNAESWQNWLRERLQEKPTSAVLVYGDSRFYHRVAREVCSELNIAFFGLEEGYVRPGYVTFEEGGNNANSRFPEWFNKAYPDALGDEGQTSKPIDGVFLYQLWFAVQYYLIKDFRLSGFRRYHHHRHGNWLSEVSAWVLGGFRKTFITGPKERNLITQFTENYADQPLFFVPLQVAVDAQMVHHSKYGSVAEFIEEVITSFAENAPKSAGLVIKHHPMDRGFNHYGRIINRLVKKYNLAPRVHYVFDVDINALLKLTSGCVTVNSTVGIQAIEAGVPTKMMGTASANVAKLTADMPLSEFWNVQPPVDRERMKAFRSAMVAQTQIAGSFYRERVLAATSIVEKLANKALTQPEG